MIDRRRLLVLASVAAFAPFARAAGTSNIGFVVMHGKSGAPTGYVSGLASWLVERGFRVANLEMPWSGGRHYDVGVAEAEAQIDEAIRSLRAQGAQKIFVAGHSQGGGFALHYGGSHPVDGLVLIAPGGSVSSPSIRGQFSDSLSKASRLVAEGKGEEAVRLIDFEGGKGQIPVVTRPSVYLQWFDPEGAMSFPAAAKRMNPATPVLYVAPTDDYLGLQKAKTANFASLPSNPLTKLVEPASDHLGAPTAARQQIEDWALVVAAPR